MNILYVVISNHEEKSLQLSLPKEVVEVTTKLSSDQPITIATDISIRILRISSAIDPVKIRILRISMIRNLRSLLSILIQTTRHTLYLSSN